MKPLEFEKIKCIGNQFFKFMFTHSITIISHDSSKTETNF